MNTGECSNEEVIKALFEMKQLTELRQLRQQRNELLATVQEFDQRMERMTKAGSI